jgi:hypothetical protein
MRWALPDRNSSRVASSRAGGDHRVVGAEQDLVATAALQVVELRRILPDCLGAGVGQDQVLPVDQRAVART